VRFRVKLCNEDIAEIECLKVVAMATNFGTKIAINWLCVNDSDHAIGPCIHSTCSNQLNLHFLFTELTGSNSPHNAQFHHCYSILETINQYGLVKLRREM